MKNIIAFMYIGMPCKGKEKKSVKRVQKNVKKKIEKRKVEKKE